MNSCPDEKWKDLKLGDEIRFVRIPSLFSAPHYHNGDWDETFALYRHLIASKEVLRISEFDESERPWVDYVLIDKDGNSVSHSLAVDDDSWERVD